MRCDRFWPGAMVVHIRRNRTLEKSGILRLTAYGLKGRYFVKLYCVTRNIPTDNFRLSQNNIVDTENRYKQSRRA